jgi:hypothetical protein
MLHSSPHLRPLLEVPRMALTRRYIGAMTTPPSARRIRAIDAFVRSLTTGRAIGYLRYLVILRAHNAQAARVNLINPGTGTGTESTSPSPLFTQDSGYFGDGNGFISTVTLGSLGVTQDNCSMGVWEDASVQGTVTAQYSCGVSTLAVAPWGVDGNFAARNGSTTGDLVAAPQTAGLYSTDRNNSTGHDMLHKGVVLATKTRTSGAPSGSVATIGAVAGGSARAPEPVQLFFIGVSMPASCHLVIEQAFVAYRAAISGGA